MNFLFGKVEPVRSFVDAHLTLWDVMLAVQGEGAWGSPPLGMEKSVWAATPARRAAGRVL